MTLRQRFERIACRVLGHRWVKATLDPVLMWPFTCCRRCGHIWTNRGEP